MKIAVALLFLVGCTPERTTTWATVEKGDLVLGVEVTGAMRSEDSIPLKPPPIGDRWEFKIAEMAPEGTDVKPGDVAISFDSSDMMREMQEMQNEAESAARSLEKQRADGQMAGKDHALAVVEADAELGKASLKSDRPHDLTAVVELKVAELDRRVAAMQLEHARSAVTQGRQHDAAAVERLSANLAYYQGRVRAVQQNIGRMNVTAPRAGTIIYPTSWRGEKKKVGDSAWRMETVLEIAALDKMVADGEIDEVDSSKIKSGQPVILRLDAHPETAIRGRVKTIANIVQRQSQANPSRIVKLAIALEETGGVPLRPGMRFRGQVETGRVAGAVLVPAEAVFVTAEGPMAFRKTSGGDGEKVRLKIGQRNESQIEVLSGLAPGDQVSRVNLEEGP